MPTYTGSTVPSGGGGVTSLAGTGVTVSASTGAVTITAPVVAGGTGISVSGSQTTSLSVTNTGVTSLVAGSGISVSAATGDVTVTSSGGGGGGFTFIQRIFVTTATATVTFSSIPSGYTHYYMIIVGRTDKAGFANDTLSMRFNNDSSSNYRSASSTYSSAGSWTVPAATAFATPYMGSLAMTLFNAGNSTQYTVADAIRANYVTNTTYVGGIIANPYVWIDTSRVTTISIFCGGGANIVSPSYAELWGIP